MDIVLHPDSPARKGVLIVFEGIDGCGKTTQAGLLTSWLLERTVKANYSFEPTDGTHGKALRESFNSSQRLSAEEELELFRLDRMEHVEKHIEPGLREGWILLVDRYYYSSIAYQGVRGGKSPEEVHRMMTAFAPVPDKMLLFEVDIETALQRISKGRNDIPNLMEKRENLEPVKAGFDAMKYPEITRIDATSGLEKVFESLLSIIKPLLVEKGILTPESRRIRDFFRN